MRISSTAIAILALSCCYLGQTHAFVSPQQQQQQQRQQQHSTSFLQIATTPTTSTSSDPIIVDTTKTDDTAATNFAGTIAANAAARAKQSQNIAEGLVDEELESVEFPPPLSTLDRMKRAATFWSTAIPVVANYYGLIGNIKLQEVLGSQVSDDDIEVRWCM
jgi:hypothetical protein